VSSHQQETTEGRSKEQKMSMSGLIGETFIHSELEFRRERAMQQFNRRKSRHPRHHLAWPFHRHTTAGPRHTTAAVS
jgi:hypothetical protein